MNPVTMLYIELAGDILGGGQRSLLDIVTHLDPARYRPVVMCGGEGTLVRRLKALHVTTHVMPLPTLKTPWALARRATIHALQRVIHDEQIHAVHANVIRGALYAIQATRRLHIPVILHARIANAPALTDRMIDRYLAWRCHTIIAISHAAAQRFAGLRGAARVHVVYNGIDLERTFTGESNPHIMRQRWSIADGAPLIGLVGLLEPRKGHRVLLEAMPMVLQRYPEARLLIAGHEAPGAEGYQAQLRAYADRCGVSSHVTFAGFVEEAPQLFGSLTMCVFPVIEPEGFGRVVAEAGAMRCPVIATPLGGLRELVEDGVTGLLVPPGDSRALAHAICQLLDDPARAARLGDAGRQRAEERFSLSRMMDRIHQIYAEVLRANALVA